MKRNISKGLVAVLGQMARGGHPLSLINIFAALLRGIGLYFKTSHDYVQAKDRDDLRQAGPLGAEKHANLSAKRWYLFLTVHALYLVLVLWVNSRVPHSWVLGPILALAGLFAWGRTEPVLVPTPQIGMNATEGLLVGITNDLALTPAFIKTRETAGQPATARVATSVHSIPSKAGYATEIELPGLSVKKAILGKENDFAARMGIDDSQVHMTPIRGNSARFGLLILHEDPWDRPPTQHPLVVNPRQVDLWNERVELGELPTLEPYTRKLQEAGGGGGAAIGAVPRYGKTNTANNLIIHVLLDPNAVPFFIDGKGVDWKPAEPIALAAGGRYVVRDNKIQVMDTLQHLVDKIDERSQILEHMEATHITEQICKDGMPTLWLFLDEVSIYTEDASTAERTAFLALLGTVCRLGPTFGIYVVICTQRMTEKGLPPGVRDLLGLRIALYSMTAEAARSVLGAAGEANRADRLDPEQKGVAIVRGDGMIRTHLIGRADLAKVAAFAQSLRAVHDQARPGPASPTGAIRPQPVQAAIEIMVKRKVEYIESQVLVEALKEQDDRASGLDVNLLAARMKTLGVSPVQLLKAESPGRLRGYRMEHLLNVRPVLTRALNVVPDTDEDESDEAM